MLVFLCVVNILLFTTFAVLYMLLQFQKLSEIPGITDKVTFSYFKTRPDLLSFSKALVVYDATNQNVLLSKNENVRISPASTAKIMTALVAIDSFSDSTVFTYSRPLITADSSKMGLFVGEEIGLPSLLYGMMLPSGNDAAKLLAASFPGGEEAFVSRMNSKAKELGLLNTMFVDPAGYADENYSTAYDLALLGSIALENPKLSEIVKTRETVVTDTTGNISHRIKNLNELLSIEGVNGIKTGFTNEAEGVLVSSFLHNNTQYVIVVLRSKDRFSDTRELITGIIKDLKNESYEL